VGAVMLLLPAARYLFCGMSKNDIMKKQNQKTSRNSAFARDILKERDLERMKTPEQIDAYIWGFGRATALLAGIEEGEWTFKCLRLAARGHFR
jgi:hypothetical protein